MMLTIFVLLSIGNSIWHSKSGALTPTLTPLYFVHPEACGKIPECLPRRHLGNQALLPSPTFPRKFADVDWGSRKINRNKICAECWPGAAFGPYWLLTERLRYETTPLLPALRDRVHVHGQRDDAHGSHCGSYPASGNRRAAGASRRHEQQHRQG